jgi:type IV pilus assembly protein PilC
LHFTQQIIMHLKKISLSVKNHLAKFWRNLNIIGLREEKNYLLENLATMLAANVEILLALDAIGSEMRTKVMQQIIQEIKTEIENGATIWHSLQQSNLFSAQAIALIRVGEESGQLFENLKVVVSQQQKEHAFRAKMRSAMMYPLLILILALVIGIGIAWFILPRLATVFSSLRLELPFVTKMLIRLGEFLGEYGIIVIPAFIFTLIILFYFTFFFSRSKFIGQTILAHTIGIKKIIQEIELARFGFILGTLLEAGLPVVEALHSLSDASDFHTYKKFYNFLESSIENGDSFEKSFRSYPQAKKLIPSSVQQMIIAGEQSGNLAKILLRIGKDFENRVEITMKNFSVIFEPILLVIVWLGVVGVALAVVLPIYSLVGGLS